MTLPAHFKIEIASVSDRDECVAEVWYGDELFAELRQEPDGIYVQLYVPPSRVRWDLPIEDVIAVLNTARERLRAEPVPEPEPARK